MKKVLIPIISLWLICELKALPTLKHYPGYNGIMLTLRPWQGKCASLSYFYNWSRNSGGSLGLMLRPKDMEEEINFEDNYTVVGEFKLYHNFFDLKETFFLVGLIGASLGVKIFDLHFEVELDIAPLSWLSIFLRPGIGMPLWEKLGSIYFNIDAGVKLNLNL